MDGCSAPDRVSSLWHYGDDMINAGRTLAYYYIAKDAENSAYKYF